MPSLSCTYGMSYNGVVNEGKFLVFRHGKQVGNNISKDKGSLRKICGFNFYH